MRCMSCIRMRMNEVDVEERGLAQAIEGRDQIWVASFC